jgi:cellulose biosynthesis protein BcsQ
MKTNSKKYEIIGLLSGKGGAGKSIIGLSFAKILSESGFKVLFIDCDLATHGATYFFEEFLGIEKDYLTLLSLLNDSDNDEVLVTAKIFKSQEGFDFIPSTIDTSKPTTIYNYPINRLLNLFKKYDFIIMDCQAGNAEYTERLIQHADKNIIVLEADSVSSAALRVLYLKLSKYLNKKNTWQLFNKLTEEERKVYEKVYDETFFTNLPPIPFDWKVRAAFALNKIPSMFEKDTVFGLAIIRILKMILNEHIERFDNLEKKVVGDWFNDVMNKLKDLEKKRNSLTQKRIDEKRKTYKFRMTLISFFTALVSIMITFNTFLDFTYNTIWIIIGIIGLIASFSIMFYSNLQLKRERKLDSDKAALEEFDKEIENYKTLISTDSRLKKYYSDFYSAPSGINKSKNLNDKVT